MEFWQFNTCIRIYNERKQNEDRIRLLTAWQTANWSGAAFAGKLRKFSHYVKDEATEQGQALTRAEMDDFDRRFAEKQREEVADV